MDKYRIAKKFHARFFLFKVEIEARIIDSSDDCFVAMKKKREEWHKERLYFFEFGSGSYVIQFYFRACFSFFLFLFGLDEEKAAAAFSGSAANDSERIATRRG